MAYIPNIIVNYDSLIENRKELVEQEIYHSIYNRDDHDIMYPINDLLSLLKDSPVDINGTAIVRIPSKDTSNQFNLVRDKLEELNIQYWILD